MRVRFALIHLAASAVVVGLFLCAVYFVWYPAPFNRLEGVDGIVLLLVAVDVCLGPFLTFVVANAAKSRRELTRDIGLILAFQIAAFIYGAYTIVAARPAFVVLERATFHVVSRAELAWAVGDTEPIDGFNRSTLGRPIWVALREPQSSKERSDLSFYAALGGPYVRHMPRFYVPLSSARVQSAVAEQANATGRPSRAREVPPTVGNLGGVATLPIQGRAQAGQVAISIVDASLLGVEVVTE